MNGQGTIILLSGDTESLFDLGIVVLLGLVVVDQLANVVELHQMVIVLLFVRIVQVPLDYFGCIFIFSEFF